MDNVAAIEALYATGHWLMSNERHRDAAGVFQLMAHVAPTDERSWLALGTCHERLGQTGIAAEMFRIALSVAERPVRCGIALGRLLRTSGREDAARDAFDLAYEQAITSEQEDLAAVAAFERGAS